MISVLQGGGELEDLLILVSSSLTTSSEVGVLRSFKMRGRPPAAVGAWGGGIKVGVGLHKPEVGGNGWGGGGGGLGGKIPKGPEAAAAAANKPG